MKRFLLVPVIVLALYSLTTHRAAAAGTNQNQPTVVCLPDIYMSDPGDCTPAGPSAYLTKMAEQGITFPLTALPASPPDPGLTRVDFNYVKVTAPSVPVYASLDDALANNKQNAINKVHAPTLTYLSYASETNVDGKRFYLLDSGGWLTANGVSRVGAIPRFQGLTFSRTPDHAFGWVLTYLTGPVQTKRTPGTQADDYTGHFLDNHQVVQIYSEQKAGDLDWYMIAPDEWIMQTAVARVVPNTTPPKGVSDDRWIEINLFEQTMTVYDQRQLVYATLIASGLEPFWTRPGLFQIRQKLSTTPMRGAFEADGSDAYYLDNVPWTMYFDEARALHGAYWRTQLGFPQSHGCVNLSVGDSHWLFDWAHEGDWVYVWDPSGKTPTDPKLYSAGGA